MLMVIFIVSMVIFIVSQICNFIVMIFHGVMIFHAVMSAMMNILYMLYLMREAHSIHSSQVK